MVSARSTLSLEADVNLPACAWLPGREANLVEGPARVARDQPTTGRTVALQLLELGDEDLRTTSCSPSFEATARAARRPPEARSGNF